jgi:sugar lactone lactonase YvrE
VGLVLLAAASLFTSATAGRAAVSRHFAPYSGPSLDGLRYLEKQRPGEYLAVMWLRQNVRGTPVVLEAQGPSYQDFGRISMLTGLPTVLGWEYHVQQRGNPQSEIEMRKSAVQAMYGSPDAERAAALMRRYRVAYVYVGPLERKTYSAAGLRKFAMHPELFEPVYENPEVKIYRVSGVPTQDAILPFKETLPQTATPGEPQDEPEEAPAIAAKAAAGEPLYANLKEPRGAAVDREQRLWIADFGHSRIRVYDKDGNYLGGWGGRGSGEYGLREPCAVAAHDDAVYVADTWNGRVKAFSLDGKPRGTAGDLYGPRGIAVAPDGRVWVSDTGNHRVVSYGPDLSEPKFYGHKGSGPDEFSSPVGIAVAPNGDVYVADTSNKRIRVLGPNGESRRNIPVPAWGENVEPQLAIAPDGTVYATDPGPAAVMVLDPSGALQERIAVDEAGRRFENPTGIAIDPKDRILYVVSSGSSSIARLPLAQKPTTPKTP